MLDDVHKRVRRARGVHARGRQPAKADGEEEEQDQADEELRHGLPKNGQYAADIVNDTILLYRRNKADDQPENGGKHQRDGGEQQRRGQEVGDDLGDGGAGHHGASEVALQHLPEPAEILHIGGVVEAVVFTEGVHHLRVGRHIRRDEVVDRVHTRGLDPEENQRADDQKHGDHHQQFLDSVFQHMSTSFGEPLKKWGTREHKPRIPP